MKFIKTIIALSLTLAFCLLGTVKSAKADGGIFVPERYYGNETSQKAFIYYQNQIESLVISASYQGNAKDFAWVVPTPNKPEITKSNSDLFTTLDKITKTEDNGPAIVYDQALNGLGATSAAKPVTVVEQKKVDIYDTTILQATDDQALAKWLNDHGYTFPSTESAMLKSYIDDDWYFTIAKIQNSALDSSGVQRQLTTGAITPLRLTFQSKEIIYPMKLTKIALDFATENYNKMPKVLGGPSPEPVSNDMSISLYVLTDSKMTQDSVDTIWADWTSPKDIKVINESVSDNNWINPSGKLFLTKMQKTINLSNISNDFKIVKAPDNSQYPVPAYKTAEFWATNLIVLIVSMLAYLLTPIGLVFVLAIVLQIFVRQKWLYILCSIYQISSCLLIAIIWLIVLLASDSGFGAIVQTAGDAGFTLGSLIALAAAIFFSIRYLKKYKKIFTKN